MAKDSIERLKDARREIKSVVEKYNRGVAETDYVKTQEGKLFEAELRDTVHLLELAIEKKENEETIKKPNEE